MSCNLTSGRTEPCKDTLGGVKAFYIAPYAYYNPSQYTITAGELITFPATSVLRFETRTDANTAIETLGQNTEWQQSINMQLTKQEADVSQRLELLQKIESRVIVEYNSGGFRLFGLAHGITMQVSSNTGGAFADFNGYDVAMDGLELTPTPFFTDLADVGFIEQGNITNYSFQDLVNFAFQDTTNYDFQTD